MEAVLLIVVGGLILGGAIVRWRTRNAVSFVHGMRASVFAFAALGLGLVLAKPSEAVVVGKGMVDSVWVPIAVISAGYLWPHMVQVLKGHGFDAARARAGGSDEGMAACGFVLMLGLVVAFVGAWVKVPALFAGYTIVATMVALGALHVYLGPALAGFNLAMVLLHAFSYNELPLSLEHLFSTMELLGLDTGAAKWGALIISTVTSAASSLALLAAFSFQSD